MHVSIACALLATVLATPAHAGSLTTTNACLYSVSDEYRDQAVTLAGTGSPRTAPAGTAVTLSGASISATLPASLPRTGYDLGLLKAGVNPIPSRVWIAIAAANATPATQVRELTVTASTTIRVAAGGRFVSGTPIVVRIPIPNTTWTATGGGPVSFAQAGAGTLPNLPVGSNDLVVPVSGSIVVKPTLARLRFVMDCQPGRTAPPYTSVTPAIAQPFAGLEADSPVPAAGTGTAARIASTRLRLSGRRVAVIVACPQGTSACRGRIALRSVAPVLTGGRKRILVVSPGAGYSVPAGTRRTVRLNVGATARGLLSRRSSLRVRVTLAPTGNKIVKRELTLNR